MEFKDLQRVNDELEGTELKSKTGKVLAKDYVEVNKRVLAFRELYPEGTIETKIEFLLDGVVTMEARVYNGTNLLATGHAQEKESSSFINQTSFIENCETSAVGRALGFLGIGIAKSIASKEEVENAKINQVQENDLISSVQEKAIRDLANKVDKDHVIATMKDFGYEKFAEIKQKDYMNIVKNLESGKRNWNLMESLSK